MVIMMREELLMLMTIREQLESTMGEYYERVQSRLGNIRHRFQKWINYRNKNSCSCAGKPTSESPNLCYSLVEFLTISH